MTGLARLLWWVLLWLPIAPFAAEPVGSGAAGIGLAPAATAARLRVLVLASFHAGLPAQRLLEQGLDDALRPREGEHRVFVEYLDSARLPLGSRASEALAQYLAAKYGDAGVQVVVAFQPAASDFLIAQPALLPQARRIHAEIADAKAEHIRRTDPQALILSPHVDYGPSLAEAIRLTGAQRIVVVGDTRDGAAAMRLAMIRAAAGRLPPEITVDYLLDRPLAEVLDRSAQLPPGSIVYYLLMFGDGAGRALAPVDVAREIAAHSAVPVVSQWESLLGSGILGGYSLSHVVLGREVGRAALGVVQPSGVLPVSGDKPVNAMRHVYDARQLRRFGIDERTLPPDSVLLFREPTLLEAHRGQVIATGAVIAALVLLLLMLAASNRARRRALSELAHERELLAQRVAERTAELDDRVAELARRNDDLTMVKAQLSTLAQTDGLTGLANRRQFDSVLAQELRRLQRRGGALSLLLMDVDFFKAYNDRYGHVQGDRCLKAIAELLAACTRRPADVAARYGGEEFVLVLPDTPHDGAWQLARQLMDDLARLALPHADSAVAPHVTLSVGLVTVGPEADLAPAELLALADAQLYRAKAEGRDRIVGIEQPGSALAASPEAGA